jgi:hypothetical protein
MLGLVALAALTWGGVHYYCARGLRAHRPGARALALALGMFNLPLLPLGTGLGGYTLVGVALGRDARVVRHGRGVEVRQAGLGEWDLWEWGSVEWGSGGIGIWERLA